MKFLLSPAAIVGFSAVGHGTIAVEFDSASGGNTWLAMVPEPAEMPVAANFALMGFGLRRRRFKGNRC